MADHDEQARAKFRAAFPRCSAFVEPFMVQLRAAMGCDACDCPDDRRCRVVYMAEGGRVVDKRPEALR